MSNTKKGFELPISVMVAIVVAVVFAAIFLGLFTEFFGKASEAGLGLID